MSAFLQTVPAIFAATAGEKRVSGRAPVVAAKALFILAATFCLTPWASPPITLSLGVVLSLLLTNPFAQTAHRISKTLLQASVVLLGFGMDFPTAVHAGLSGFGFAATTITLTILLGYFVARWLGVGQNVGLLISAGTAICGGSAIAAVGSSIDADEGDLTIAMGAVFLLNAAALYLFPVVGHAIGLTPQQFGTWAGVAIHDVSSVIGAASRFGLDSLQTATAVKLSRTLWIVPLVLGIVYFVRRERVTAVTNSSFGFNPPQRPASRLQVPWFVGLFLIASLLRSALPAVASIAPSLTHLATIGLTLTLFLVGTSLTRKTLSSVGWRAIAQASILWIFISAISLMVIKLA